MKEQLISFETAKLAKEKKFNYYVNQTYFGYHKDKLGHELNYKTCNKTLGEDIYAAPTQSLLQKWLREEHSIHIDVFIEDEKPYKNFYYRVMNIGEYFVNSYYDDKSITYEDSLEKALKEALKLI